MKLIQSLALSATCIFALVSCTKDVENSMPVANAGMSRSIKLPQDTVKLRGTATDSDGALIGYIWKMVSGPNRPFLDNSGSDSALVMGLVKGTYQFEFTAIDDKGGRGFDTVQIEVLPSDILQLSQQPSFNEYEGYLAGNDNGYEASWQTHELGVIYWTDQGVPYGMRPVVKFDLSSIPANATIVSAKLSLYSHPNPSNGNHISPNSGSDISMLIQRVTSPWTVSSLKWNNKPSTTSTGQVIVPHTALPSLDLLNVDVKSMVAAMVESNNYGFAMKLQNEALYNSRIFCSSRHSDASKHPKLVVEYRIDK